jgi:DNA-binding transcriptional LysR family regulator
MKLGVAILPRRCAQNEIERRELLALQVPELKLNRQVRLVYRSSRERSHASAAFLTILASASKITA